MVAPKKPSPLSRLAAPRRRAIEQSARRESVSLGGHCHHHAMAFHPEGKLLATASGSELVLVHLDDGHRLERLRGHAEWISSLAFDATGDHLVSVGWDGTLIRWQMSSREPSPRKVSSERLLSVALSPEGRVAYTVGLETALFVVDLSGERPIARHPGHRLYCSAVGVSSDGQCIVSSDSAGDLRLWTPGGECRAVMTSRGGSPRMDVPYWPVAIRFRPGSSEALLACRIGVAALLDTRTPEIRRGFADGHTKSISDALWLEESGVVVTVAEDSCISLWDTARGDDDALRLTLKPHATGVATLALSPDGRSLATLGFDGQLLFWDVPTLVAAMPA